MLSRLDCKFVPNVSDIFSFSSRHSFEPKASTLLARRRYAIDLQP